ncbi:hypothetical protein DVH24_015773 [Malus domestica]|uniref:Uncharacterized protein n=1 Tax=Malus domestica TaxID=3750 RepID=A0A498HPP4_MALDO|nr:hypothetical protein DVH24_015773 [Malus domestica]
MEFEGKFEMMKSKRNVHQCWTRGQLSFLMVYEEEIEIFLLDTSRAKIVFFTMLLKKVIEKLA